jgi:hypothetical protein
MLSNLEGATMTWTVYGEVLTTSDASSTTYYQKIVPTDSILLKAVRTHIIQNDNPTYTAFSLKLYSNNSGTPRALIASSTNSPTKAAVFDGVNSGVKECYFEFANIPLRGGETYHLILNITGYTGSDSSHIAWKHSFPDPAYQTSVAMTYEGLLVSPFDIVVIGSKL